jgi:hypothetical protein
MFMGFDSEAMTVRRYARGARRVKRATQPLRDSGSIV